eukprot:gb/GECG01010257.1/.p1 GENE.gb/GECG01010257.1/~~gb/GECG01010257.1/.p1  ORF type:complete len:330 (+),score=41.36 gb/GECG01010257.1/:1-990(+)
MGPVSNSEAVAFLERNLEHCRDSGRPQIIRWIVNHYGTLAKDLQRVVKADCDLKLDSRPAEQKIEATVAGLEQAYKQEIPNIASIANSAISLIAHSEYGSVSMKELAELLEIRYGIGVSITRDIVQRLKSHQILTRRYTETGESEKETLAFTSGFLREAILQEELKSECDTDFLSWDRYLKSCGSSKRRSMNDPQFSLRLSQIHKKIRELKRSSMLDQVLWWKAVEIRAPWDKIWHMSSHNFNEFVTAEYLDPLLEALSAHVDNQGEAQRLASVQFVDLSLRRSTSVDSATFIDEESKTLVVLRHPEDSKVDRGVSLQLSLEKSLRSLD